MVTYEKIKAVQALCKSLDKGMNIRYYTRKYCHNWKTTLFYSCC